MNDLELRQSPTAAICLYALLASLIDCVTPVQVAAAVLNWAQSSLGADAAYVGVVSGDGGGLDLLLSMGYQAAKLVWTDRMTAVPSAAAVATATPLYFDSRADRLAAYSQLDLMGDMDAAATADIPLATASGQTIGVLHLSLPKDRPTTEEDHWLMEMAASHCGRVLERAFVGMEGQAVRKRLEFVANASELLTASLDYETTLQTLAEFVVPELADTAVVYTPAGDGGTLRHLAVAHRRPEMLPVIAEVQRRFPPELRHDHPTLVAIARGESQHIPYISNEMMEKGSLDPAHRALIMQLRVRAYLTVPLSAHGTTFGAITLAMTDDSGRRFSADTISIVEELARRVGATIDISRVYAQAREEIAVRRQVEAERTQALHDVDAARRQIETVLKSIDQIFYSVDQQWRLSYVNRRGEQLWGRNKEEIVGKPFWDLFPSARSGLAHDALNQAMAERRAVSFETMSSYLGRWVEGTAYPAEDGGLAVYFKDIHDRKVAEEDRRRGLEERERLLAENSKLLQEAAVLSEQQRLFLKNMLSSVTDGRLTLCETSEDLPTVVSEEAEEVAITENRSLARLRESVQNAADAVVLASERTNDLLTAVSEGGMNALRHAGGGEARVYKSEHDGVVQVWICDQGKGIEFARLPDAMFRKGYSSAGTLGHGFKMILTFGDRVFVLTGPSGTTVVIEQYRQRPLPAWV